MQIKVTDVMFDSCLDVVVFALALVTDVFAVCILVYNT